MVKTKSGLTLSLLQFGILPHARHGISQSQKEHTEPPFPASSFAAPNHSWPRSAMLEHILGKVWAVQALRQLRASHLLPFNAFVAMNARKEPLQEKESVESTKGIRDKHKPAVRWGTGGIGRGVQRNVLLPIANAERS